MIHLKNYTNIILASGSPRRKTLLEQTGLAFSVVSGDVNEDYPAGMPPDEVATFLSEKKAEHFSYLLKDRHTLLITADTMVILSGEILGKPADPGQARKMLESLSGKKHEVITGVTLKSLDKTHSFISTTSVYFKPLTNDEIGYYVDHYKPFDKAGSYGIQEWIGYIGVERMEGSYSNVVGLPVQRLYQELMNF